MQKPSIPKGTRDFTPTVMMRRQYIMETIRTEFKRFGFMPIETPSMEKLDTLMGKYGEEGDRLIFKILNSGDYLKNLPDDVWQEKKASVITRKISEKALRYDLTVPFARFVVQNQNELIFPFKRYQIQPVWRADRPQKGRFREFYQCDADVVGSRSLYQEVAFIQLYDAVFSQLGLDVTVQINHRKILAGIAEIAGITTQLTDFTTALDKLDKIGEARVKAEMRQRNISEKALEILTPLFRIEGDFSDRITQLKSMLQYSSMGRKGIEEVEFIYKILDEIGLDSARLDLKVTLARGLNYYTGCIFEVSADGVQSGSIGGGGRYDDLSSIFGLKNTSGAGISFGLDRIYLVLETLNLFPEFSDNTVQLLFLNLGEKGAIQSLKLMKKLRKRGINAELYPDPVKIKKQMTYADKKQIPFTAFLGDEELQNQKITLKNMVSGEQLSLSNVEEMVIKMNSMN